MKLVGKAFCRMAAKMDVKRLETFSEPTGVIVTKDIPYAEGGTPSRLLNIYRPENETGKLSLLVDIHGGGWWYGDKDLNRFYDSWMAKQGFAVISFSYRLAPYVTIKEQVQDVFALFNKAVNLAEEYGFDLNNAFLTGDSAGGHLASIAINCLYDEGTRDFFGVDTTLRFRAVNFTCAAFYPTRMTKIPFSRLYFREVIGKKYKKNPVFRYLDFKPDIPNPFLPCTIITGGEDFLKDCNRETAEYFKGKGGDFEFFYLPTPLVEGHQVSHVFNILYPEWEEGIEVNTKVAEFFKKHMLV